MAGRNPMLRYRWHPERERWEFFGWGAKLWRQSFVCDRNFPPDPKYVVNFDDTVGELEEVP